MKKTLFAFVLAASAFAISPSASATTFPSLTTIYLGTGVRDDGFAANTGTATVFHCSNVSGVSTSVRFLVLGNTGNVEASVTRNVIHGQTITVSTNFAVAYGEDANLGTGFVGQGVINIESLQSGVFCNAMTIDAAAASPDGVTLPLVRVNPHPGTVE